MESSLPICCCCTEAAACPLATAEPDYTAELLQAEELETCMSVLWLCWRPLLASVHLDRDRSLGVRQLLLGTLLGRH